MSRRKRTKQNITEKNSFHRQLLDCRKLVALVARFVVNYKEIQKKNGKLHDILLRSESAFDVFRPPNKPFKLLFYFFPLIWERQTHKTRSGICKKSKFV